MDFQLGKRSLDFFITRNYQPPPFSAQISFRRIEVVLCKERSLTVNSPVVVFLLNSVLDVNLIYTLSDYNSFKLEQMDFQSLAKLSHN